MNAEIVRRWNEVVSPDDVVYHLGDVALGPIEESLSVLDALNGSLILVEGNHDRTFMDARKPEKHARWTELYGRYFVDIVPSATLDLDGLTVNLSHFPYDGDSHEGDRYKESRLVDEGVPLIHGHTHSTDWITLSNRGTIQLHVGVDAWDYRPVPLTRAKSFIDAAQYSML